MSDDEATPNNIDLERLLRAIDASGAEEVHVEAGSFTIRFSRTGALSVPASAGANVAVPASASAPEASSAVIAPAPAVPASTSDAPPAPVAPIPAPEPTVEPVDRFPIRSPMAGIFYHCPKPGDPPFVVVGDRVEPGSPIGIVEVMKLMTTVNAEVTGIVREIAIDDAAAVGYGDTLVWVEADD